MIRQDLLNLSEEDLITVTNRGAYKRSVKELQQNKETCEINTDGSTLLFIWSDNTVCTLAPDKAFSEEMCDCPSTKICRHIVRSILYYQSQHEAAETPEVSSWSPAEFTNEQIDAAFDSKVKARLQKQFDNGLTIELFTGAKPMAYIHEYSVSVRFPVQDNLHFTQCNCDEIAPCSHVFLACMAFRQMPVDEDVFLYYNNEFFNADLEPLTLHYEKFLNECLVNGLNTINDYLFLKLNAVRLECEKLKLEFPALVIDEINRELTYYNENNARFDPHLLLNSLAEFLIRIDALKNKTEATPANFIKGFSSTKSIKMDSSQFIGLGCHVKVTDKNYLFSAYVQNAKTGQILAACNTRSKEDVEESFGLAARSFRHASKSLADLGKGRISVRNVNCQTDRTLKFGRQTASYTGQNFQWEKLGNAWENFDELQKHLLLQPPASLRPRYVTEDFVILKVTEAKDAYFDTRTQEVCALLIDEEGREISLRHPYLEKNSAGTEHLLTCLQKEKVIFISGHVRNTTASIIIEPTAIIHEQGKQRFMVQPWIDSGDATGRAEKAAGSADLAPLQQFFNLLTQLEEDLLLLGCQRIGDETMTLATTLLKQSLVLGLVHYSRKLTVIISLLEKTRHSTSHCTDQACTEITALLILHKLSQDIMN